MEKKSRDLEREKEGRSMSDPWTRRRRLWRRTLDVAFCWRRGYEWLGPDADRRKGRQRQQKQQQQQQQGQHNGGDPWVPSALLRQLVALDQPISVRTADGENDVLYHLDLVEEVVARADDPQRRSVTFFLDADRTDDDRVTLGGLMMPDYDAWTMILTRARGGVICEARMHVRPHGLREGDPAA
ncbi:MAG TPA: hypothetical protein VIO38_17290 [Rariglobus sp.]